MPEQGFMYNLNNSSLLFPQILSTQYPGRKSAQHWIGESDGNSWALFATREQFIKTSELGILKWVRFGFVQNYAAKMNLKSKEICYHLSLWELIGMLADTSCIVSSWCWEIRTGRGRELAEAATEKPFTNQLQDLVILKSPWTSQIFFFPFTG